MPIPFPITGWVAIPSTDDAHEIGPVIIKGRFTTRNVNPPAIRYFRTLR